MPPLDTELRNRLIFAFYIPSVLIAIAYSILTPVLPVFAAELTNAYFIVGIILAAESIGRMAGDLPASYFLRRIGIKNSMLLGLVIAIVPIFLVTVVQSIPLLVGLLFVSGIGHAFYNISRHAYISVVISTQIRGRAISLLGGAFRAGAFVGPILGGWVAGRFGLRASFLLFVLVALLTMLFVWWFMLNREADQKADDHQSSHPSVRKIMYENRSIFASAGIGQILAQLTREGWRILIPLYAATVLDLDVAIIGTIVGLGRLPDVLFFWLSGIIMDRFGRKWAIVPSFIMQSLAVGAILLTQDALMLGVVAAVIGFANGISSGTMMTLGADLSPPHSRSEFLAVWRLIGDVGFVAAPVIIGSIGQVLMIQTSILTVMGTGLGAAILFAGFVPETLKRKKIVPETE